MIIRIIYKLWQLTDREHMIYDRCDMGTTSGKDKWNRQTSILTSIFNFTIMRTCKKNVCLYPLVKEETDFR